jgi:Asp-tRNA(Asn)/Glu-tRNA(Gln) amidotransferase A subunit family amidase
VNLTLDNCSSWNPSDPGIPAENVRRACTCAAQWETELHALVPEADLERRLREEAAALEARMGATAPKPPLFGSLVGIKDIISVDGFETRAGSVLPPVLFDAPEAPCVTALRKAGGLIFGKTATTEFAYLEPAPTRNPLDLNRTPGGSSSGSAAGVAAGYFPLALGTQTSGSVIRPAAFCGIVGFKPSYGAISTQGVVPFSTSVDTVGLLAADIDWLAKAAPVLIEEWQEPNVTGAPVCGVPVGAYLEQADPAALVSFAAQVNQLREAGFTVLEVPLLDDIEEVKRRHWILTAGEVALVHQDWFDEYRRLYRPLTAAMIEAGRKVSAAELKLARNGRAALRQQVLRSMVRAGIDMWICPAAPGPAPVGLERTGDPAMNTPWTHAGMPAVTVPANPGVGPIPLGIQCVAAFGRDADLIQWSRRLLEALGSANRPHAS